MSTDAARAILIAQAASIGRFQAPELWYSQSQALATPAQIVVPVPMPLTRPAESIIITLALRATVANANMTAVFPESPQTLLQQILLNGTHRKHGAVQPWQISGATAFAWLSLFQQTGNDLLINGNLAARLGRPTVSPFTGLVGDHELLLTWNLPLGPIMGIGQSTKRDLASFLYQGDDWGDTLRLQLTLGDASVLGTPTTAGDVTLSGPGGVGNPLLSIYINYSILGPFANALDNGIVLRNEQSFTQFQTAGNNQRLGGLQKQITPNVILKSGTAAAGLTASMSAYDTLVDTQLDRSQITVDRKPVKFNQSNLAMKTYVDRMFSCVTPAGYLNLTFVDGQNPSLAYRGDGLAGASAFEIITDILTSGATQNQALVQEMIYGGPFPDLRAR
jgi:hypothetical protein